MLVKNLGLILPLVALLLLNLCHLHLVPSLHFDEAWSATFSHRIAFETRFWPLHAMSPYTSPWLHYIVAAAFRMFGENLLVFRAVHWLLSFFGAVAMAAALREGAEKKGAAYFLLFVFSSVALLTNHRFGVELTSFLPFCFGLSIYFLHRYVMKGRTSGLSLGLTVLFMFLGTTSHILFFAWPLSLLALVFWEGWTMKRNEIRAVQAFALLLLPFFLRSIVGSSWPAKVVGLVLADLALVSFSSWNGWAHRITQNVKVRKTLLALAIILFIIFGFNFLVFLEGYWGILFQKGQVMVPAFVGVHWVAILGIVWIQRKELKVHLQDFIMHPLYALFVIFLVTLGLLMITPAPRYFEMAFLLFFFITAHYLSKFPFRVAAPFLVIFVVYGCFDVGMNYLNPEAKYAERSYRFLTLKETSYDWLPKREAIEFLHAHGCELTDVTIPDERLRTTLLAFERLDFAALPQTSSCEWSQLTFERGETGPGNVVHTFPGSRLTSR